MINVLLADDEPLLLRSLKKTIESLDDEYRVIGTASDGRKALEMAAELVPDVIFTDIRMPMLDGLEFTEEIRKRSVTSRIVLISGYKEFEYAKKAITLGVEDYLVKPINPLTLKKLLVKMRAELKKDINEKQTAYLQSLTHGGGGQDIYDLFGQGRCFFIAYLCFGTYISYRNIQFQVGSFRGCEQTLLQILAEKGRFHLLEGKYDNEKIIVGEEGADTVLPEELYEMIREKIDRNVTMVYSGGITDSVQFREKFLEAGLILKKELVFSESRYINTVSYQDETPEQTYNRDIAVYLEYWREAVCRRSRTDMEIFLKKQLKDCEERKCRQDELTELLRNCFFVLGQQLQKHIDSSMIDLAVTISQDYRELEKNISLLLKSVLNEKEDAVEKENVHTLESVKDYIDYHYTEKLSIMEIADRFGFSYSYFCTGFKKCFGESPNDYIIKKRIFKAKMLFDTEPVLSIKEVAAMTGYDNPYYFSRIFKNVTGDTPSQYRKRRNTEDEI